MTRCPTWATWGDPSVDFEGQQCSRDADHDGGHDFAVNVHDPDGGSTPSRLVVVDPRHELDLGDGAVTVMLRDLMVGVLAEHPFTPYYDERDGVCACSPDVELTPELWRQHVANLVMLQSAL